MKALLTGNPIRARGHLWRPISNGTNKYKAGSSTLEILIAFAVLIICITAVILVGFGNQSVTVDSETNNEALYKAQKNLEDARATSRQDFSSVLSTSNSEVSGPLTYAKSLLVADLTQCKKQATSSVTWSLSPIRQQKIELTTFLTDVAGALALGGDCASTPPNPDDWRKPKNLSYSGLSLKTEGYGKAVDSQNNKTFLVTTAAGNNKDDFYIFDTTDINNPVKHGHLDISDGLEDIDVARNFAFIANDETQASSQLVVVNVSDIDTPTVVATSSLPGVTGTCPNTCPGGRTIYYYKNRVYIGTHRLVAGGAAEFHVFDVTTPSNPIWLGSKGGVALGDPTDHNINDIVVRDQTVGGISNTYAYIATSASSSELLILNVTNPASIPNPTGTSNTGSVLNLPGTGAGEDLDATSIFIIGNRAYIGRERATGSNKDFYVVDISNPATPSILGSTNLGLNSSGSSVVGIQVVSNLALVANTDPNKPLVILDISNPALITRWDFVACGINLSTYPTGIDFDNNLIYLSLHNAGSNINLVIIKPTGGSC
jgi:Tfp pilus assembly protein PilV